MGRVLKKAGHFLVRFNRGLSQMPCPSLRFIGEQFCKCKVTTTKLVACRGLHHGGTDERVSKDQTVSIDVDLD
jgi:hypothetical protein